MKKIKYPDKGTVDYKKLIDDYSALFSADLSGMEVDWLSWKKAQVVELQFPETVKDLLVADTAKIADVYVRFTALGIPAKDTANPDKRNPVLKTLDGIFHYTRKYDSKIAAFFEDRASALGITSCHYCDLSYINVYTLKSSGANQTRRHFDLDHFLPKSECPIIALSLFNFVPSCQVCNSRIKLANTIGSNKRQHDKFNPASDKYDFDKNVKIRLRMNTPSASFSNPNDYYIHYSCNGGYGKVVDFFHLEERYEFHKVEAIRLKRLKSRYPKSAIRKIANLLGKSEYEVYEDLFHKKYLADNGRCFEKLTRDMLR